MFENSAVVWAVGGLATLLAGLVAYSRRTLSAVLVLAGVVLVTLVLLVVQQAVVTPRERLVQAVDNVLAAIKANDVARVTASVDPATAGLRRDVEALMKTVQVEKCHAAGEVRVAFVGAPRQATSATTRFKGFLNGISRQGGVRIAYFDEVEVEWRLSASEDLWQIVGYTAYYKGRPINAVASARGAEVVPQGR